MGKEKFLVVTSLIFLSQNTVLPCQSFFPQCYGNNDRDIIKIVPTFLGPNFTVTFPQDDELSRELLELDLETK